MNGRFVILVCALVLAACATDETPVTSTPIVVEEPQEELAPPVPSEAAEPDTQTQLPDWTPSTWSAVEQTPVPAEPVAEDSAWTTIAGLEAQSAEPGAASGRKQGRWISLAELLESHSGQSLPSETRRVIDNRFAETVADEGDRDAHKWRQAATGDRGELVLKRLFVTTDGVTCSVVDHRHWLDGRIVAGSVTACLRGDGAWHLTEAIWWRSVETQSIADDPQDARQGSDSNWHGIPE